MSAETERRFEVSRPQVVDETIDGEVVAINLDTGSYYSIAGTGAVIWEALDQGASLGEIVAVLDPSVTGFVDDLRKEGLIRPSSNGAGAAAWTAPVDHPFEPPHLEKFTDLEDLLLLDPVHDIDARGWPHAPSG